MKILILLLFFWNLCTFFLCGIDKRRAKKGKWRISEKCLLLSSACFGAWGMWLGMQSFRHKTKHPVFVIGVPVMAIIETLLLAVLWWFWR